MRVDKLQEYLDMHNPDTEIMVTFYTKGDFELEAGRFLDDTEWKRAVQIYQETIQPPILTYVLSELEKKG